MYVCTHIRGLCSTTEGLVQKNKLLACVCAYMCVGVREPPPSTGGPVKGLSAGCYGYYMYSTLCTCDTWRGKRRQHLRVRWLACNCIVMQSTYISYEYVVLSYVCVICRMRFFFYVCTVHVHMENNNSNPEKASAASVASSTSRFHPA